MPEFVITYHGGKRFETQEEGRAHGEKWLAWMRGLGDAVVNPGVPLGAKKVVTAGGVTDGSGPDAVSGYSIFRADDMDTALAMVQACPHLAIGTIQVSETMDMKMI